MNENVSAILKGVVGLVSELDKLPGVSTQPPEKGNVATVRTLNELWDKYQKNLHNGYSSVEASDDFISGVGRMIDRSRYEYRSADYAGREDMGG